MIKKFRYSVILLPVLISGCGNETLHGDLTERQANEIVAALRVEGIAAQKKRAQSAQSVEYSVTVSNSAFPAAVAVLEAAGLPHRKPFTLADAFPKQGLTSTTLEEKARLRSALQEEIEHQIESTFEDVVEAHVNIVVPEYDPIRNEKPQASASVLIKTRAGSKFSNEHKVNIIALIKDAVEHVQGEKITVVTVEGSGIKQPVVTGVRRNAVEAALSSPISMILLGTTLLTLIGSMFLWFSASRKRASSKVAISSDRNSALTLDELTNTRRYRN